MKKITKIEYQKKNKDRVSIYLDDSFAFGLDLNIMIKYSLSKNMELADEFINEIIMAEEEVKAYNYALSVLSRSAKSEKKLREKMQEKGYDVQIIDKTTEKLKKQKYLDDGQYSEMLIRSKINISKYGKRRIKEALYEKGIDREIIEEKLGVLSDDEELARAYSLGIKKIKTIKEEDARKKMMKLSNYLINKGFEYSIVKKVVSQLLDNSSEVLDEITDY